MGMRFDYKDRLDRCGPRGAQKALYGPPLDAWLAHCLALGWSAPDVAHARGVTVQTAQTMITRHKQRKARAS